MKVVDWIVTQRLFVILWTALWENVSRFGIVFVSDDTESVALVELVAKCALLRRAAGRMAHGIVIACVWFRASSFEFEPGSLRPLKWSCNPVQAHVTIPAGQRTSVETDRFCDIGGLCRRQRGFVVKLPGLFDNDLTSVQDVPP